MSQRKKITAPVAAKTQELRMWCIQQATAWPMWQEYQGQGAQGLGGVTYGAGGYITRDADLIGRAEKIYDYITKGK